MFHAVDRFGLCFADNKLSQASAQEDLSKIQEELKTARDAEECSLLWLFCRALQPIDISGNSLDSDEFCCYSSTEQRFFLNDQPHVLEGTPYTAA